MVTSICAQCHVRTGKSESTGRPYPDNVAAGDNPFRDFEIDFSTQGFKNLSTADRHVLENVRHVVVFGEETMTCFNCHDVHGRSSKQHPLVSGSDYCLTCRHAEGSKRNLKQFSIRSQTCGYLHPGTRMTDKQELNYEQLPADGPLDETDVNLRAYFARLTDDRVGEYDPKWSDDCVVEWDQNLGTDGVLMLNCCEHDVDVTEYHLVLELHISYRRRYSS